MMSRIERKLKKQAQSVHEQILARSEEKHQAFLAKKFPQNTVRSNVEQKPRFLLSRRFAVVTCSIIIAITALVIALVKLLPSSNGGDDNDGGSQKQYQSSNEESKPSSITSINSELSRISIQLPDDKSFVTLTYDSISSDHLYYHIVFNDDDSFESARVFVTVNTDYRESFAIPAEPIVVKVNGFDVKYTESFEFDEDIGLYLAKSDAVIITSKEHVYIAYETYCLDESSNFLSWLTQTIIAK